MAKKTTAPKKGMITYNPQQATAYLIRRTITSLQNDRNRYEKTAGMRHMVEAANEFIKALGDELAKMTA